MTWRACVCGRVFEYPRGTKPPSGCSEHRRTNWHKKAPGRDAAYLNAGYRALRASILATKPPCSVPGCPRPATTLDHVLPLSQGGRNTRDNLRPMCEVHNRLRGASLGGRVTEARRKRRE